MTRGGKRKGAGRPKGTEPTKAVRLPLSVIEALDQITKYTLPLYLSKVPAGFPSPAEDFIAEQLNLNQFLIKHPSATFFVRARGNSMEKVGIFDNDILVVDRSLTPSNNKIVIAAIDGQLTVKRFYKDQYKCLLKAENDAFPPIELKENNEILIWGVVTSVIHEVS